jgi:LPS-assembly protein
LRIYVPSLVRLTARGVLLLLYFAGAPAALAQSGSVCPRQDLSGIGDEAFFSDPAAADDTAITLEAGRIEATLGDRPTASLSGGVLLRRGQRLAGAESAVYDPASLSITLDGDVRYRDPATEVRSDSAEFSYSTGRIVFNGAEFQLGQGGARGSADAIDISREGTIRLGEVSYTTCPPGSNDWLLEADDIRLDTNTGIGTAKNVALRFQGVPFLYAPRLSFPLGDARKTGFLAPEVGSAQRNGNEISVPYYWNIAPNYDATLTPRLLTTRGLQIATEFRYLTERNEGALQFEYLPNDDQFGDTRRYVEYRNRTVFDSGLRNLIDVSDASDGRYFEDLRGSLSAATITHLNRSVLFDYYADNWSFLARFQDYQTIDEAILPEDDPYRRLPQIELSASLPYQPLGLRAGFDGEIVNFDRDVGVTGWRVDLQPRLTWGFERPGWFLMPEVVLQHTEYKLDDTLPGEVTDPSRTLPVASLDLGLNLERRINGRSGWIQTLEPRVLYVHVPYRDQSALPVFDTIVPDLNLVQLYRKNRFLGIDRIADTDQLSVGFTSRILDGVSGEEAATLTVGQIRYLSAQGVTLPGDAFGSTTASDYVAELRFLIFRNFNFDIGHQWGDGDRGTTKSEARLQYRPSDRKVLNLAYRFRRDSLEQGDISWSWPLTDRWNFVGRYNYSLREDEVLEQFYGLEYESCCWGLRLVTRRYVSTREGTQDSAIGLQLVLKGMASVGSSADRILERGILGYSSVFD